MTDGGKRAIKRSSRNASRREGAERLRAERRARSWARSTIVAEHPAGDDHQVVSVSGGSGGYRRTPCSGCPWRVDQTGSFPAEAFAHSARTAYDMAEHQFGCHESGVEISAVCAGFLLRGAEHNLATRMAAASGRIDLDSVSDGDLELHPSYRAMAEANGVDPQDPVLAPCRDGHS